MASEMRASPKSKKILREVLDGAARGDAVGVCEEEGVGSETGCKGSSCSAGSWTAGRSLDLTSLMTTDARYQTSTHTKVLGLTW